MVNDMVFWDFEFCWLDCCLYCKFFMDYIKFSNKSCCVDDEINVGLRNCFYFKCMMLVLFEDSWGGWEFG